jgi:hypothetical protein
MLARWEPTKQGKQYGDDHRQRAWEAYRWEEGLVEEMLKAVALRGELDVWLTGVDGEDEEEGFVRVKRLQRGFALEGDGKPRALTHPHVWFFDFRSGSLVPLPQIAAPDSKKKRTKQMCIVLMIIWYSLNFSVSTSATYSEGA